MRRLVIALLTLALASPVMAQTPPIKNPTGLKFQCPDHGTDTGHEVDIINATTGAVIQTLVFGDPAADGAGDVTLSINVQPVAFGTYRFVARAVAGGVKGQNSVPSDVWERVPGSPSKPVVL